MKRKCKTCGEEKPIKCFPIADKKYRRRACKICFNRKLRDTGLHRTQECIICGRAIARQNKEFCSTECKGLNQTRYIQIDCQTCGKGFSLKRCRKDTCKFCSVKCRAKWQKTRTFSETHKKNLTLASVGKKKSKEHIKKLVKARSWMIGRLHPLWKGGKRRLSLRARRLLRMSHWREAVFERDNYTCQHCGVRGVRLNADHIRPFALLIEELGIKDMKEARACDELWDTSNGRTLCEPCHALTPHYKGKYRSYVKTLQNTNTVR